MQHKLTPDTALYSSTGFKESTHFNAKYCNCAKILVYPWYCGRRAVNRLCAVCGSYLHLVVWLTAEVPVTQTGQKISWCVWQEPAQSSGEPLLDRTAVLQLLISQHRQSHLINHVQNLHCWRTDHGHGLWDRSIDQITRFCYLELSSLGIL